MASIVGRTSHRRGDCPPPMYSTFGIAGGLVGVVSRQAHVSSSRGRCPQTSSPASTRHLLRSSIPCSACCEQISAVFLPSSNRYDGVWALPRLPHLLFLFTVIAPSRACSLRNFAVLPPPSLAPNAEYVREAVPFFLAISKHVLKSFPGAIPPSTRRRC